MLKKGQAGFDEKADLPGPVPLDRAGRGRQHQYRRWQAKTAKAGAEVGQPAASAGDSANGKAKGYLVVCGNSGFADNTHVGVSGNGDLFLNMANYLAEEESLITIEPREKKGQPLVLTQNQGRMLFGVSLILVPFVILLVGFGVYRVRRSQR